MATTTPNYGWAVPTSTDLVKDGATAIETLGDAIDASMNTALGTKKAMGVLLSSTSFSGVSSVSLPADTFTATYRHYRFMISGTASGTTGDDLNFRLRASGSDNSTNNYYNWRYIRSGSAASNSYAQQTQAKIGFHGNVAWAVTMDLFNPQTTDRTTIVSSGPHFSTGNNAAVWCESVFDAATQFDSATFFPEAGTFTGTIYTYAYNV
jgi:hypothetical protein